MSREHKKSYLPPSKTPAPHGISLPAPQRWLKIFAFLLVLACQPAASTMVNAQEHCPPQPHGGGEGLSVSVTVEYNGLPVTPGMVVPAYSQVRIDSVASAFGSCDTYAWICPSSGCVCEHNAAYVRSINHTNVWADVSTASGLNGIYFVGTVQGRNPDGTGAFYNVLDSQSSTSTGPNYFLLSHPGRYKFMVQAVINTTPCEILPGQTDLVFVEVFVGEPLTLNSGVIKNCFEAVGAPVNVTTGNMYLQQTDYELPGVGGGLQLTRTYNSLGQSARPGLFGHGWSSAYDESLDVYGTKALRLNLPDGRAVYLSRETETDPYLPKQPLDFRGQITRNADSTYTLSLKDSSLHRFNAAGKLTALVDRNSNQTTLTYDTSGRLSTIADAAGRTLTLTHTADGIVSSISDSVGVIATYTSDYVYSTQIWDWVYRLRAVTYPDGSQVKFTYDFPNRLTVVKDALDNVLEAHTYDSQGRALTSERHGGVELMTLNYVSATETDVTDALGHLTKYFYNANRGRNVVTRVEGHCECGGNLLASSWTYDSQLNMTAQTNALGRTTTYTYDASGNQLTMTNAAGTTSFTYNQLGEVLTMTDPMNGVTGYTYDTRGNLLSTTNALNKVRSYTYDARGLLLTTIDPRNNVTSLSYDANGNLTSVTDALGHQSGFVYNARGQVAGATDALSNTTGYTYDAAGRLKTMTQPGGAVVTLTYDLAGQRTRVADARSNNTDYAYDAAYRLTSETNAASNATSYSYDSMSNPTSVTDALGRTTNYTYDEFNRLVKITYPEAATGAGRLEERFAYDAAGNLTQQTDQAGRATNFTYDNLNRLASATDALSKVTRYEYDARSQMTAVVDALDQRREFVYDALGRLTEEQRGGVTMFFAYDAAGNRTSRTDYNGVITNYTYDVLNRLTQISYPNSPAATYGYDALSRLTAATNENGTVTFAYNSRSHLSATTDVWNQTVGYAYDANSNRTALSVNGATSASYQYDALNRLTQLTDGAGAATTFGYDVTDKLTSRSTPNGVSTTYQYDGLDRLTRLKHIKGATTLADYQYQLNAVGNITQQTEAAGAHTYAYDVVNRLTAATHPAQAAEGYTYDGVGNRTSSQQSTSYTYQAPNRQTVVGALTYSYDLNGNLTQKTDTSGVWSYQWDYENQLKQASVPGGLTLTYKYDALGRRVQRQTSAGGWTKFVYDGEQVIRDLNSDGSTVEYLNGPGIDNKLRQTSAGDTHYFVADHLGSTRALTDASGNVVETQQYDSFGQSAGSALTRYGYTGRERDAETGLYYYRARWYDPQAGRFLSEDPIGLEGGINLYAYVKNNPANWTDPLGLCEDKGGVLNCYHRNQFSSLFEGTPYLHGVVEFLEIGPPVSVVGDLAATLYKSSRSGVGGATGYASGLNYVIKRASQAVGSQKMHQILRPIGDKITPVFAVTGVFTLSYNSTILIQCLLGVLE
jgi:RHS repeat-associated protein